MIPHTTVNDLIGNPAVLKTINTVRIMNHLRRVAPASRAELARSTHLDAKTITNICKPLIEQSLIIEETADSSGPGRPASVLKLNARAAGSLGVDIGASQVTVVRIDLCGSTLQQETQRFDTAQDRDTLIAAARGAIDAILSEISTSEKKRLAGIGLCVPGFVDPSVGCVINSVNIKGLQDFNLVESFADILDKPVILEESSRAMALAEIWFDPCETSEDALVIDLGFGIGMGIIHKGLLFRGARGAGGEIGHTVVEPDGIECRCGRRGCLETVASGRALAAVAESQLKYDVNPTAQTLYDAAAAGHTPAAGAPSKPPAARSAWPWPM